MKGMIGPRGIRRPRVGPQGARPELLGRLRAGTRHGDRQLPRFSLRKRTLSSQERAAATGSKALRWSQ